MKWLFFIIIACFIAILIEEIINTINLYISLKYGKDDKEEQDNLES